jgi:hypothetical protein
MPRWKNRQPDAGHSAIGFEKKPPPVGSASAHDFFADFGAMRAR